MSFPDYAATATAKNGLLIPISYAPSADLPLHFRSPLVTVERQSGMRRPRHKPILPRFAYAKSAPLLVARHS
jgi:hypothetical protein